MTTLENVAYNQCGFITEADVQPLIDEGHEFLTVVIRCHEERVQLTVGGIKVITRKTGGRLDVAMKNRGLTLRDVYIPAVILEGLGLEPWLPGDEVDGEGVEGDPFGGPDDEFYGQMESEK